LSFLARKGGGRGGSCWKERGEPSILKTGALTYQSASRKLSAPRWREEGKGSSLSASLLRRPPAGEGGDVTRPTTRRLFALPIGLSPL